MRTVQCVKNLPNRIKVYFPYSTPTQGSHQREGMGLLEYLAMPSLRDVAPGGVLCAFSNRSAQDRDKWCGRSGQAAQTVHHVQNHTLLGHSLPASQVSRSVGPAP